MYITSLTYDNSSLKISHVKFNIKPIYRNANLPCNFFSKFPFDLKLMQHWLSNLGNSSVALLNVRVEAPITCRCYTLFFSHHTPSYGYSKLNVEMNKKLS